MTEKQHHVCPVEHAGSLDNRFRRWLQNPAKILAPYIREGMTVLDVGCGSGFFTRDMALMVGDAGHVIACDLQVGMLDKLRHKIEGTQLADRITLHQCAENQLGVTETIDFALAFYVVHELRHHEDFFREIHTILRPKGQILIVEPPLHVSKSAFAAMIYTAESTGFSSIENPKVFLSKTVVLQKC